MVQTFIFTEDNESEEMVSSLFLRVSFSLCSMLSMNTNAYVQRVVINNSGEKIIMYPDGTWRPVQPADSILLQQYANQPGLSSERIDDPKRNVAEEQEFLLRQWNGLYLDLVAEEKEVQDKFRMATNAQFKASEELQNAEANKKLVEPDRLATLHEYYDSSVDNLRMAKLQQKEIKSLVEKGNKINAKPDKISQSKINRIKTAFTIYLSRHHKPTEYSIPASQPVTSSTSEIPETAVIVTAPRPSSTPTPTEAYDPKMIDKRPPGVVPVAYVSQPYPCHFDTDTIDQVTGKTRLEMHPEVLFTYTDPDLRPFFKNKDLITSRAMLSKIGSYTYLSVEFQIASSHSQSNFGTLAEGSLLRFKLMDGEYVSLYNLKAHNGRIDPYSGYTIFIGQYALGKQELKDLASSEADKMRVMWSTGYEDYEIYKVDLLIDQLQCLDQKK
ncbi:MAG TPA: hypothetical protein VGK46_00090 [Saprospiraceae bacterium]